MLTQNAFGILTRREAAATLRVGISTYKTLVARGLLREVSIGTRGRRLPASEVERFIRERPLDQRA